MATGAPGHRSRQPHRRARDALFLLRADHAQILKLFARYQSGKNRLPLGQKRELALAVCRALIVHLTIEEEVFYPAVGARIPKADRLLRQAKVQHDAARRLIAQIRADDVEERDLDALVDVLAAYIKLHVHAEQLELFPKARPRLDLTELGEELASRRVALSNDWP